LHFSPCFGWGFWKGGAKQAAEKPSRAVILSAAKNLALPLRVNYAKDLALSIFKAMRDSSSLAAPQNDSADKFSRSLFSPALSDPGGRNPAYSRITVLSLSSCPVFIASDLSGFGFSSPAQI
jgi:hypothetical protein